MRPSPETVISRLEGMSIPEPNSGCLLWLGNTTKEGYGQAGKEIGVFGFTHRIAYEMRHGPIPRGLVLDHLCSVPCCCNPDHLEAVTQRENVMRGRGRAAANARKEKCDNGHELSGANLYKYPNSTSRACRTCMRALIKARRLKVTGPEPRRPSMIKDVCKHGHMMSGDNLRVNQRNGERSCRECARLNMAKSRAAKKGKV